MKCLQPLVIAHRLWQAEASASKVMNCPQRARSGDRSCGPWSRHMGLALRGDQISRHPWAAHHERGHAPVHTPTCASSPLYRQPPALASAGSHHRARVGTSGRRACQTAHRPPSRRSRARRQGGGRCATRPPADPHRAIRERRLRAPICAPDAHCQRSACAPPNRPPARHRNAHTPHAGRSASAQRLRANCVTPPARHCAACARRLRAPPPAHHTQTAGRLALTPLSRWCPLAVDRPSGLWKPSARLAKRCRGGAEAHAEHVQGQVSAAVHVTVAARSAGLLCRRRGRGRRRGRRRGRPRMGCRIKTRLNTERSMQTQHCGDVTASVIMDRRLSRSVIPGSVSVFVLVT